MEVIPRFLTAACMDIAVHPFVAVDEGSHKVFPYWIDL